MDGVGEWATTSAAIGDGSKLEIFQEIHFPHSLGLLYSAATYYTGFKVNSGEYKVMGLAPYGEPKYAQLILDNLIDLKPDGSFRLDMSYFDYCTGLTMTNERFAELFGEPVRTPDKLLTPFHMDVAASIQAVLEEAVLRLTRSLADQTGVAQSVPRRRRGAQLRRQRQGAARRQVRRHLDPAGGRRCRRRGGRGACRLSPVQGPAAHGRQRRRHGRRVPRARVRASRYRAAADGGRRAFHRARAKTHMIETTAQALADQLAVGWFQGRMEFGPRSLGARSILGDPRSPAMQKNLNLKVKYRESFRPFAPAVLREDVADWFELDGDSPYMLIVADVREDKRRAHDRRGAGAVRHRQAQRRRARRFRP